MDTNTKRPAWLTEELRENMRERTYTEWMRKGSFPAIVDAICALVPEHAGGAVTDDEVVNAYHVWRVAPGVGLPRMKIVLTDFLSRRAPASATPPASPAADPWTRGDVERLVRAAKAIWMSPRSVTKCPIPNHEMVSNAALDELGARLGAFERGPNGGQWADLASARGYPVAPFAALAEQDGEAASDALTASRRLSAQDLERACAAHHDTGLARGVITWAIKSEEDPYKHRCRDYMRAALRALGFALAEQDGASTPAPTPQPGEAPAAGAPAPSAPVLDSLAELAEVVLTSSSRVDWECNIRAWFAAFAAERRSPQPLADLAASAAEGWSGDGRMGAFLRAFAARERGRVG